MAAIAGAAIAGGAALLGTGANAWSTGKTNKKTRQWNEEMYGRQRADNHRDWIMQNEYNEGLWNKQNEYNERMWHQMNQYNEGVWNTQNAYNSPASQMQRYKEAGLNPNLIYGQSNTGGSISTANLETDTQKPSGLNGASPHSWNPRAPQFDFKDGIMSMAAFREQSARTNNLEKQNEVLQQEVALKAATTASTLTNTARTKFDLDLASELRQTSVDAAQAGLRKVQIESDIALKKDEREAAQNASGLREAAQRIANMRGQNINAELDAQIKKLDIELKQSGVQPGDNLFFRILGRFFGDKWQDAMDKVRARPVPVYNDDRNQSPGGMESLGF